MNYAQHKLKLLAISALFFSSAVVANAGLGGLQPLQQHWAKVNYELKGDEQKKAFGRLVEEADALLASASGQAEPLIWKAIILSTRAGVDGGLGALSLVKEARDLLLDAEKIDPQALHGSVYTSLGSLYYQVPGWPIGFGDDEKAEAYLKKALAINPDGIDPNYFYADYLYQEQRYSEAARHAENAINAPAREGRPVADQGRREEAAALLKQIQEKLTASKKSGGSLWN